MSAGAAPEPLTVAMMQPTFLPWTGYFALMDAADVFVLLDDFQFRRKSFHHRNRVFVGGPAVGWVTVPVEHSGTEDRGLISEVRPLLDARFRAKTLRLLRLSYAGSDHVERVLPLVERAISRDWDSLADLNISLISDLARMMGITARLTRSSEVGSSGPRSLRIVELLRKVGATVFLDAAGAEAFLREDAVFPLDDIDTRFQRYSPAPYRQTQSQRFVPYLSALDVLLQVGPEAALSVIRSGSEGFVPWDEALDRP